MTLGERIEERRKAVGIKSQAELARRADVPQGTLNGIINRPYRWSPHLSRIAGALDTTVAFLTGEIDDPDAGAPAPSPRPLVQHILMPVALPSEAMLAQMFEGLLETVDRAGPLDELARELAQLLPIGLSQLRGRLIGSVPPDQPREVVEAYANALHEPRR